MKTLAKVKNFIQDERAASAVEYALLVAGISLTAMAVIHDISVALKTKLALIGMPHAK